MAGDAGDYTRQVLRELWSEHHWEVAWCAYVGVSYASLFVR